MISVTHSEEELDVDVEEGTQKEEDSEPRLSRDKEPSTSAERTKQEVRDSAYKGPLPRFLCSHGGSARCRAKT